VVYFNRVSDHFFDTLGPALVAGRDFNAQDALKSPKVALVNQTMATRFFAGANPIGKRYRTEEGNKVSDWVEIIGIVKDAKYGSLREETLPTAYVSIHQESAFTSRTFELSVATGSPTALIPAVKSAIAEINRDVSIDFSTLSAQIDESLTRERLPATLSGFFGALALLLATIGLYGVYNVARRRGEIGIRMALGAEQSRVLRMVLKEVELLIAIGLTIGMVAALATTRFVESFLYGMKPNDPWTLSLAAGVLAFAAALAGFLPARRASSLDPMIALREE
jgi:predicted permease